MASAYLALVLLLTITPASRAEAFHEVSSFSRSANTGGGANRYYSGSPRSKGYECTICHVDAEERIAVEFSSQLSSGSYTPGLIYPITLRLLGEHRGLGSAFNPNTFSAELIGPDGMPVGRFAAGGDPSVELRDQGTVAIAEGLGNGEDEWSFSWWAPEEGSAATLYVAMLDGDGANDAEKRFIDPYNDDVATLRVDICPADQICPASPSAPEERSPAGCSLGASKTSGNTLVVLLLCLLWLARRNRTEREQAAG